jgi:hypothetical protein
MEFPTEQSHYRIRGVLIISNRRTLWFRRLRAIIVTLNRGVAIFCHTERDYQRRMTTTEFQLRDLALRHTEAVDAMGVHNGKITEHWGVAILFSLMQQLSASPLATRCCSR